MEGSCIAGQPRSAITQHEGGAACGPGLLASLSENQRLRQVAEQERERRRLSLTPVCLQRSEATEIYAVQTVNL
jgi:hypothetical protein